MTHRKWLSWREKRWYGRREIARWLRTGLSFWAKTILSETASACSPHAGRTRTTLYSLSPRTSKVPRAFDARLGLFHGRASTSIPRRHPQDPERTRHFLSPFCLSHLLAVLFVAPSLFPLFSHCSYTSTPRALFFCCNSYSTPNEFLHFFENVLSYVFPLQKQTGLRWTGRPPSLSQQGKKEDAARCHQSTSALCVSSEI